MNNKVIRGIISVLSGSIATLAIGIIYNPILVRISGKELYGEIANFAAIYAILSIISQLGMFDAIRKFLSNSLSDKNNSKEIIMISLLLPLFIAIILFVILFFSLELLVKVNFIQKENLLSYIILFLSLIPLNFWVGIKATLFSFHDEDMAVKLNVLIQIIHKFFVLILILKGVGLIAISISFLIANSCGAIFGFTIFYKKNRAGLSYISFRELKTNIISIMKFGLLSTIGVFSAQLLYKADIILINYFTGSVETAVYKTALVLAEMLWLVPKAIQGVLFHNSSELWGMGDKTSIVKLGNKFLIYTSLVLILLGVGLFVLARPFITLYFGLNYVEAVVPLRILIGGSILFGISRIIVSILKGTDWVKIVESITFFVSLINIFLNIILIPRFGINGAAVATSITYGLILIANLLTMKVCKVDLKFSFPFFKIIVLFLCFFLIYQGLFSLLNIKGIIDICLMALFGLIMFCFLAYKLKLISKNDIKKLNNK